MREDVLAHTARLPSFPAPRPASAWADWDLLCADLAAAESEWEPGTVAAEHALTYGHLLGELVRRVDGREPAVFIAEEIGADLGFALSDPDIARCAELEYDTPDWPARMLGDPDAVHVRAVANPAGARGLAVVNSALWRRATVPAVNLHTTATAVARFYAALLDGTLPALAEPVYTGMDLFLETEVRGASAYRSSPTAPGTRAAWAATPAGRTRHTAWRSATSPAGSATSPRWTG
jgi:CubicO group peptidase (beta-lactamase class C family)